MKAYGKSKRDTANRKIRGTSMACPCCVPRKAKYSNQRFFKRQERRRAKRQIQEQSQD